MASFFVLCLFLNLKLRECVVNHVNWIGFEQNRSEASLRGLR